MRWRVEVTKRCSFPKDDRCIRETKEFLCGSIFEVEKLRQDFFDQHTTQCLCGCRCTRLISISEVREKERYKKE